MAIVQKVILPKIRTFYFYIFWKFLHPFFCSPPPPAPPPFLKWREVNFKYLPWRGNLKNFKNMVQVQVFLKVGGWHCSYLIFLRFIIFTFRNYFTLCKIVLCIWEKLFFSAIIILLKKVILSCLQMNLKISHKLI